MDKHRKKKQSKKSQNTENISTTNTFRRDANAGILGVQNLEHLRSQIDIPVDDYLEFLRGSDNLDKHTLKALEEEYETIKREQQIQQSKSKRGGVRQKAGRKAEGVVSKLLRVTGTPEEMKLINRWLKQSTKASRRLTQLILRDIGSRFRDQANLLQDTQINENPIE